MIPVVSLRPNKVARVDSNPNNPVEIIQHDQPVVEIQPPQQLAAELDLILQQHPEIPNQSPNIRKILMAMLEASAENKTIVDFRNPRKGELQLILQARRQEFLSHCEFARIILKLDQFGEPLIYSTINDAAFKLAEEQRLQQMGQLIRVCRGAQVLANTRPESIPELYQVCVKENNLIGSIRSKLDYLMRRAGLAPEVINRYGIIVQHTGEEERFLWIRIADGNNLLMGYSIYDLLYSIRVRGDQYYGEMEFILTDAEAEQLYTYLTSLITWIDDFTNILADLLGPNQNPEQYVQLAQRTRQEILHHPIRMSPGVISSLKKSNLPTCLIMGHLSLNLAQHPHRDFLKAKFQALYDSENVLDSAGEPKHFHIDEAHRTNLGLVQLKAICPGLNKLIKLQQLTTDYINVDNLETKVDNLEDALKKLKKWGYQNELQVIIQYKIEKLLETYRATLGEQTPPDTSHSLDHALANLQNLAEVEAKSLELCKTLLTCHTALFFRPAEADFRLTKAQMDAMYNKKRKIRYEGNQVHRNVAVLFKKLNQKAVMKEVLDANPGFTYALTELQNVLISRLNNYHRLQPKGFYGKEMVDETVQYFEQYVSRIIYAEKSKVTKESIERSLRILSGIIGSDLERGCNQGLAGRMKEVLIALSRQTGDDLSDHLLQYQKECLEEVFQQDHRYNAGGENSMLGRHKGQISEYLGLSLIDNNVRVQFEQLSPDAKDFLARFLAFCTPWKLYTKAYQFFCDKFWQLNSENNDEGIYQIMETLQFEGTRAKFDLNYRVNGDAAKRWQYAFFQQDLPRYLMAYLMNKYLTVKLPDDNTCYLKRDGEELHMVQNPIHVRDHQEQEEEQQDPQQELSQANPRRIGFVPESALPNYDRMTA